MKHFFQRLRKFITSIGLVEQAQIVASTAVVVIMVTIITVNIVLEKIVGFIDFISIITVGVIGFVSVYFSLKYGRVFEEQKSNLESLNTVAKEVSQTIDIEYLFNNVFRNIIAATKSHYGWIYLIENKKLVEKNSYGTNIEFFNEKISQQEIQPLSWISKVFIEKNIDGEKNIFLHPDIYSLSINTWASIPLKISNEFAGIVIFASKNNNFFTQKKIDILTAFCNHISVGLNNAKFVQQLQNSRQEYYELFEFLPDMYHLVDNNGIIVQCNNTEAETLGYTKEELIGKPLSQLYPEQWKPHFNALLKSVFEQREPPRFIEEQLLKKDGTIIDVSVKISLVYDETHTPILMRCVSRDITEKQKLEQQLIHMQKIESVGRLAGEVAHDFNNILTSILGSVSIMQQRIEENNPLIQFINIIETTAKRGSAITQQLLNFARKTTVEFKTLNLHTLIDETANLFHSSAMGVTIIKNYHHTSILIKGDEGRLQQALLNIFINARDAMSEKGKLTIETILENNTVIIKITDTGVGMTKEVQENLFVPFFTTKEVGKGTGLGLSVVYGVVRSHDGSISVESAVGKGTTFSICLPFKTMIE